MLPSQIVPTLLNQGTYIASVLTFYKVLRKAGQFAREGRAVTFPTNFGAAILPICRRPSGGITFICTWWGTT